jgi:hypothetical protein
LQGNKPLENEVSEGDSGEVTQKGHVKEGREKLRYKSLTSWVHVFSFVVSFTSLIIYLAEADFTDETLYILLIVMRYSSFLVCLCSLYKIFMHIYGLFRGYKFRFKRMFFLFALLMYGICVVLFESFIIAISRGNG